MKKYVCWLWCAAVVVFFVDWTVVGLSILSGDYEILGGVCVGAVCLGVILLCPFLKLLRGERQRGERQIARGQSAPAKPDLK